MKPIAEGYVDGIKRKTFWCTMEFTDKNIHNVFRFEAQIYKSKLSKTEAPFLCEGAYMMILKGGTIRFNRGAKITKKQIREAEERARKICKDWENLGWKNKI